MSYRRTTLSKFIIDDQRRTADPHTDLTSLLNDIQTACKLIAVGASRGLLDASVVYPSADQPDKLDVFANDIMVKTLEWGGQLAGMVSGQMETPHVPEPHRRGHYLLAFNSLDGAPNIDVNMPVGSIFSVLRNPEGVTEPVAADFLQPGTAQVAAGFTIYGPTVMMVITLGAGVHGFTLDREIGAFTLTHPDISISPSTREFAVNVSNERFWEPPIQRYVEECIEGAAGPRGEDFNMRWIASMVAQVYRVLIRSGLMMYPRDMRDPDEAGRLKLLYEANPMAMIVEQAGGGASTGRRRILEIIPESLHQTVPIILGSREEVDRVDRYHTEHDLGIDPVFAAPLFNTRSLFRP